MNVIINTPRILQAMREKGWDKRATCVMCGIHWRSLNSILDGAVPKRLPAWYRLLRGLEITEQEALIATARHSEKRSRLVVLPGGRQVSKVP